jgi:hypothetical protein
LTGDVVPLWLKVSGTLVFWVNATLYSADSSTCLEHLAPIAVMDTPEESNWFWFRPYRIDRFSDYKDRGEERAGESLAAQHGFARETAAREADENAWRPFVRYPREVQPIAADMPLESLLDTGIAALKLPEEFASALTLGEVPSSGSTIANPLMRRLLRQQSVEGEDTSAFWRSLDLFINAAIRKALPPLADPILYFSEQWGSPVPQVGHGWHVDQFIYQPGCDMNGVPAYFPARGCHIRTALPWPIDHFPPGVGIPWGGEHRGVAVQIPQGSMMVILGERTMHAASPSSSTAPRMLYQTRHAIYGNPPNRR